MQGAGIALMTRKALLNRSRIIPFLAAALLLLSLGLFAFVEKTSEPYPELTELSRASLDESGYEQYFTELAKEKGALYAFDVLRRAHIPSPIDVHSVAHGVGYVLYDEKGIDGMRYCTQEFSNACSHSVFTQAFIENGPDTLSKVTQSCMAASESGLVHDVCFHGLGHGALAYFEYDFESAIQECRRAYDMVVRDNPDRQVPAEEVWHACVGGVTMELTQGDHDPDVWAEASKVYFPASDPLMPCNAAYVSEEVRPACYWYLSGRFLEAAGGEKADPDPSLFDDAFAYCREIPESDAASREGCYGGFGADLLYVAVGDVRITETVPDEKLSRVHEWCAKANDPSGAEACSLAALYIIVSNGKDATETATNFCKLAEAPIQNACYNMLVSYGRYFLTSARDFHELCALLPGTHQESCRERESRL